MTGSCQFRGAILESASRLTNLTRFSIPSLPLSPRGPAWVWQSAVLLSNHMGGACGRLPTLDVVLPSNSHCRTTCRRNMTTSSSPIVFIVDDEEDIRLAMRRILKTVNLRAELFATAQDFLQRHIPDVPSCLVLDVRLPGMGGLEVQQKLIEAGINIPIIFITAHGDIPMTVKAMKSGAFEFL